MQLTIKVIRTKTRNLMTTTMDNNSDSKLRTTTISKKNDKKTGIIDTEIDKT